MHEELAEKMGQNPIIRGVMLSIKKGRTLVHFHAETSLGDFILYPVLLHPVMSQLS